MVRKTLTDSEIEYLDMLIAYVMDSEEQDYEQRKDEGDSVEDHAYEICLKLSKLWE